MKERSHRFVIILFGISIICLLAIPVKADYNHDGWPLVTRVNGTINGSVFTDCIAFDGNTTLTLNTNVPDDGTIRYAYLYTGIFGGSSDNKGWHKITFNDDSSSCGLGPIFLKGIEDTNPNVWCTGSGRYWIWYNVTDLVVPGSVNTATTSKIASYLDGRVLGTALVVVFENSSKPRIQYWINDGSDALSEGHDNGTTFFNGSVGTNIVKSTLTMVPTLYKSRRAKPQPKLVELQSLNTTA